MIDCSNPIEIANTTTIAEQLEKFNAEISDDIDFFATNEDFYVSDDVCHKYVFYKRTWQLQGWM